MAMDYENIDLTGVSFSPDMPLPMLERRRSERQISIYRAATVRVGVFQGLCLIRNISAGGLMGKVARRLPVSAPISTEIRAGDPISGRIIWTKNLLLGVQFDEPIDVMQALHPSKADQPDHLHRMPRLNIACAGRLAISGIARDVRIVDISQGGAKIEALFLHRGDQVVLTVIGLEARRGVVCWSGEGHAGISFNAPIAFDQLAAWASRHQSGVLGA